MKRNIFVAALFASTMCMFAGCEVEKTEPGRAPSVSVDPGKPPQYDVDAPSVDVKTEERDVKVPDVDINTRDTTVKVPNVDVIPADEDKNDN